MVYVECFVEWSQFRIIIFGGNQGFSCILPHVVFIDRNGSCASSFLLVGGNKSVPTL